MPKKEIKVGDVDKAIKKVAKKPQEKGIFSVPIGDNIKLIYRRGETISQNYDSNRLDVGMEIDCNIKDIVKAYAEMKAYVDSRFAPTPIGAVRPNLPLQVIDDHVAKIVKHEEKSLAEVLDDELNSLMELTSDATKPSTSANPVSEVIPDEF